MDMGLEDTTYIVIQRGFITTDGGREECWCLASLSLHDRKSVETQKIKPPGSLMTPVTSHVSRSETDWARCQCAHVLSVVFTQALCRRIQLQEANYNVSLLYHSVLPTRVLVIPHLPSTLSPRSSSLDSSFHAVALSGVVSTSINQPVLSLLAGSKARTAVSHEHVIVPLSRYHLFLQDS